MSDTLRLLRFNAELAAENARLREAMADLLSLFPGHDEAMRLATRFGLELGTDEIIERARRALKERGEE